MGPRHRVLTATVPWVQSCTQPRRIGRSSRLDCHELTSHSSKFWFSPSLNHSKLLSEIGSLPRPAFHSLRTPGRCEATTAATRSRVGAMDSALWTRLVAPQSGSRQSQPARSEAGPNQSSLH